jgi:SSS family solute:Na+ symporter
VNWTAIIVFVLLFGFVTVLGFVAAHWRRGDLTELHEWGLAGRRLGTIITWFLLGGDVYTAYTFIAVPALVFGAGAIGFFALPYTIIVYPLVFLILPRMWAVAHKHNYITAADFVQGRYGNRWLALAVAVTGIVATMPYIALQLLGLQVVIGAMGVGTGGGFAGDIPLIIAFVILAAFTYTSGLRAPAMIAVVKDTLIYITVLALVIVVPYQLGGYGNLFAAIPPEKLLLPTPGAGTLGQYSAYATLALGSAFALFLYPHTMTAVLSSSGAQVIRRNAAYLPAYSFHCRNSHLNSSNTNRTSLFRRSFCILFPTGSRAWRSPRSASAASCRPPSCRSRPRICSRATFMSPSSIRAVHPHRKPRMPKWSRSWSKWVRSSSSSSCPCNMRSSCNFLAASGSARRFRP